MHTNKKKCLFVLMILMLLFITSCKSSDVNETNDLKFSNIYFVSEFLNDDTYNQYMNDDGSMYKCLKNFYDDLKNAKEFKYAPFGSNEIELIDIYIPECCREDESYYEINGQNVVACKSIQVTDCFLDLFKLDLKNGRNFINTDYDYYESKTIPIIVGNSYNDYYNVGDSFKGYYLFELFDFGIIGVLKSNTSFYNKQVGGFDLYDNFIVMPFSNVEEDFGFNRIVLLQEICGFMSVNDNREKAVKEYYSLLQDCGLNDIKDQITINAKAIE